MAYILYASTYISLNYFCHLPLANIFELESQFALTELKSSSFFRQKTTSVKTTNKRAIPAPRLSNGIQIQRLSPNLKTDFVK